MQYYCIIILKYVKCFCELDSAFSSIPMVLILFINKNITLLFRHNLKAKTKDCALQRATAASFFLPSMYSAFYNQSPIITIVLQRRNSRTIS